MLKQLFEQWIKHIRANSGFRVGMASVANVSGLPCLGMTAWMTESASDQEKLSEDWRRVAGDFGSAFEKQWPVKKDRSEKQESASPQQRFLIPRVER